MAGPSQTYGKPVHQKITKEKPSGLKQSGLPITEMKKEQFIFKDQIQYL